MNFKRLLVVLALASVALAQPAGPNTRFAAGTLAASSWPCSDTINVGSVYTQTFPPTSGTLSITSVCQQTGTLAYAWVPLQVSSTSGGGTVVVASGKTFTVNNSLTLAGTDATTATFPATSITVPGTILTDCGSSASCATPTTRSATMKVVTGTIAFSAATTAAVTGISPAFTSATSYACSAYNGSHNYTWNFTTQTTTGFTITAGTSNSDTWAYTCSGY